MARRINYLHYLSNLQENELLYTFFKAQADSPQKGDWIVTVKEDIKNIGMDIDIENLRGVKKYKFKKNVKKYIYKAAFEYLLLKALPTNHSNKCEVRRPNFKFIFLYVFRFLHFFIFLYFCTFVLLYFLIWLDGAYELPCKIWSL